MRSVLPAACAALLMLTACGEEYDEDAHRADLAEALGQADVKGEQWSELHAVGEEMCDDDERTMEYATAIAADSDDPERRFAIRRVNIEHLCPERLEEFDELVEDMDY